MVHFGESVSTCRFGQRCGEVICKVVVNAERSLIERLKEAEEKVQKLELQVGVMREEKASLELEIKERDELHDSFIKGRDIFTNDDKLRCDQIIQSVMDSNQVQEIVQSFINNYNPNGTCLSYFCMELGKAMDRCNAQMSEKIVALENSIIEPLAVISFPRDSVTEVADDNTYKYDDTSSGDHGHRNVVVNDDVMPPETQGDLTTQEITETFPNEKQIEVTDKQDCQVVEGGFKVPCPMCGFCESMGERDKTYDADDGSSGNSNKINSERKRDDSHDNDDDIDNSDSYHVATVEQVENDLNNDAVNSWLLDEETTITTTSVVERSSSGRVEETMPQNFLSSEQALETPTYRQTVQLQSPVQEPLQYKVNIEIVPPAIYELLINGSVVVKKSSAGFGRNLGLENARTIKISDDLRYLFWADKGSVKSKYIPLACFEKVSIVPDVANGNLNDNIPSYISLESREGGKGFVFSFGNIFFPKQSKYSPTGSEMKDWFQGLTACVETARRVFYLDHDLHTMHSCDDV